jgi:CRISPR-associated exonuclease Cas4
VQETFGKRPPYGILHYASSAKNSRTFAIDFTPALEEATKSIITEMQSQSRRKQTARSHDSPARCARCAYRSACDQFLPE